MKRITVLGVTGSIGTQTVDVVVHHRDEFEIVAMSAGRNIQLLEEIMQTVNVHHICVQNKEDKDYLAKKYPNIHFYHGQEGLMEIATFIKCRYCFECYCWFCGIITNNGSD